MQQKVYKERTGCLYGSGRGAQAQKGLAQVLLQGRGGFHSTRGFTPLILGWRLHVLEEGFPLSCATLVLHLQEMLGALALLLSPLVEVPTANRG